uniref:ABC-type glutathione-S-conjugate transporter n=1 Tax=Timema californicum TaxID=61474 RepID=A0A7R9J5A3_TIMCA|nr:unnamed protein product [Timema californicum]
MQRTGRSRFKSQLGDLGVGFPEWFSTLPPRKYNLSGQSSWLQVQRSRVQSPAHAEFICEAVGLERGVKLNLVRTNEELLEYLNNSSGSRKLRLIVEGLIVLIASHALFANDANVTWNTDDPDLTPCFQRTLLIYLPCAFLWAFSPLEVFYILNNKNSDIPWNWLNCSKMVSLDTSVMSPLTWDGGVMLPATVVWQSRIGLYFHCWGCCGPNPGRALSSFLVALSVADLAYAVSRTTHSYAVYPVHYCTPIITAATMALVAVLQFYNKKRGLRTSGVLFMFWFFLALLGAVEFRYQIRVAQSDALLRAVEFRYQIRVAQSSALLRAVEFRYQIRAAQSDTPRDLYYFHIIYILFYVIVLAQFILTFFIEAPPSTVFYSDVKNWAPPLVPFFSATVTGIKLHHMEDKGVDWRLVVEGEARRDQDWKSLCQTTRGGRNNPCPEQAAPFPSRLFFSWFDGFIWTGYRRPLEKTDLWGLNPEDLTQEVVPKFCKHWDRTVRSKERKNQNATFHKRSGSVNITKAGDSKKLPSVLPAICRAFGPTFLFGSLLRLLGDVLTFASPQLLGFLIAFVSSDDPMWKGYLYAGLILLVNCVQAFINAHFFNRMMITGTRVRSAIISVIYRKALTMSYGARKESTVGEVVNLMAVDANRAMEVSMQLNMFWSAPLQISLALYYLWQILGPSVLAGLGLMILMVPLNSFIANKVKSLQIQQMKSKDKRIKLINEVLNGIRVLKLYAWEPSYEKELRDIRNKEVKILKKAAYLNAATSFAWTCAPFLVSLVTFATFVLIDENNVLDAEIAFVSLSLFNIIRMPLGMIPMLIMTIIQALVSLERINKFLAGENLNPENVSHESSDKCPLLIQGGTFSWGVGEQPVVNNVNLRVDKGALIAVVGTVGSGKSSLMSAILGEMDKVSGHVNTQGSIAFVPQQAWIQNASLKENIMFGKSSDELYYDKVIEACALKPDFKVLPGGDNTEIGEKGINLSGGQKQRVSLARAVYNDADIYLLDDPLSAVDSHVGKHIFEKVIGPTGLLNNKTRVLVTHGITFLPEVDLIVVLTDGEVSEKGTYKELMQRKGAFADFLDQHLQEVVSNDATSEADLEEIKQQLESSLGPEEFQRKFNRAISRVSDSRSENGSIGDTGSLPRRMSTLSTRSVGSLKRAASGSLRRLNTGSRGQLNNIREKDPDLPKFQDKKLIEAERAEVGNVKWVVYKHYMAAIGLLLTIGTLVINAILQGFQVGSNVWLTVWSENEYGTFNFTTNLTETNPVELYLGVYGMLGLGQVLCVCIGTLTVSVGTINAANTLHNTMLANILRLPQSLFDTTPTGRILTRFSSDVNVLDTHIPMILRMSIPNLYRVAATFIVISCTTPLFISVIVPVGILYYFIQRVYVSTSRQVKRLESIARAPVYSHFGESITGAAVIRAYGVQSRFIKISEEKVDFNQMCIFPNIISNCWLFVRLELIGSLITFFTSLFAVLGRETMNPGLVGLSVSYALQITMTLNMLVRVASDIETNIVAVERIKEYSEYEQVAIFVSCLKEEAPWENPANQPSKDWPTEGRVQFKDYKLRYREGLELVLKGLNFTISGGEKVGIVGRTGAGKSSLTLALFRIIEPAGGSIIIDGVDIIGLGLHVVRSRITIIPQDPVLFSGSLRQNLDPFNNLSDDAVWKAIDHAHLKSFVKSLPAGLNHQVSEGGDNLSVGQRQLICLARALLRKTKVLVLDEATAAVDLETDDLIQATIRKEFQDCTVLTIAHRLNTILDSNRVLVLDQGQVVEFDTPHSLLQKKDSVFYGMAKDAGLV